MRGGRGTIGQLSCIHGCSRHVSTPPGSSLSPPLLRSTFLRISSPTAHEAFFCAKDNSDCFPNSSASGAATPTSSGTAALCWLPTAVTLRIFTTFLSMLPWRRPRRVANQGVSWTGSLLLGNGQLPVLPYHTPPQTPKFPKPNFPVDTHTIVRLGVWMPFQRHRPSSISPLLWTYLLQCARRHQTPKRQVRPDQRATLVDL